MSLDVVVLPEASFCCSNSLSIYRRVRCNAGAHQLCDGLNTAEVSHFEDFIVFHWTSGCQHGPVACSAGAFRTLLVGFLFSSGPQTV